jgi:hypothetical protein
VKSLGKVDAFKVVLCYNGLELQTSLDLRPNSQLYLRHPVSLLSPLPARSARHGRGPKVQSAPPHTK